MYRQVNSKPKNQTINAGQIWNDLKKARRGYAIAEIQADIIKMKDYKEKIQFLKKKLNMDSDESI